MAWKLALGLAFAGILAANAANPIDLDSLPQSRLQAETFELPLTNARVAQVALVANGKPIPLEKRSLNDSPRIDSSWLASFFRQTASTNVVVPVPAGTPVRAKGAIYTSARQLWLWHVLDGRSVVFCKGPDQGVLVIATSSVELEPMVWGTSREEMKIPKGDEVEKFAMFPVLRAQQSMAGWGAKEYFVQVKAFLDMGAVTKLDSLEEGVVARAALHKTSIGDRIRGDFFEGALVTRDGALLFWEVYQGHYLFLQDSKGNSCYLARK